MITIEISGFGRLQLTHLLLDYNGTLAADGKLLPGVADAISRLSARIVILVVTADTFSGARLHLQGLPCEIIVLEDGREDIAKRDLLRRIGAGSTAAIGNGANDALMLAEASVGIAVLQSEGASTATLQAADVVCPDIRSALGLLEEPKRLLATLRR